MKEKTPVLMMMTEESDEWYARFIQIRYGDHMLLVHVRGFVYGEPNDPSDVAFAEKVAGLLASLDGVPVERFDADDYKAWKARILELGIDE